MAAITLTNLITASGYVRVQWTDSEEPADFYAWRLYYRSSTTGAWKKIYETLVSQSSYDVHTYAWATRGTQAIVLVYVTQNPTTGELTEGDYDDDEPFTYTGLAKYWLVHPTDPALTVQLNIVTAEDFTPEIESEVMNLLDVDGEGGRRKVNVGTSFGRTGQLEATIYDDATFGTATVQREAVESLYRRGIEIFLRDPFGGLSPVFLNGCSFKRVAGLGTDEGLTANISYTELDSGTLPS